MGIVRKVPNPTRAWRSQKLANGTGAVTVIFGVLAVADGSSE